jgi:hypothetical protein
VLSEDLVFHTIEGPSGEVWIGTNAGIAVTDREFRAQRILGAGDGLPTNRITSGATLGGKFYFSGDSPDRGAMAIYDPRNAFSPGSARMMDYRLRAS